MKPITDVESLTELWAHPQWKQKSQEFVSGKPCAWCGAKLGDTFTDKNGSTRRVVLTPHHIEKHLWGLKLYNKVASTLFNEWHKYNKDSHTYYLGTGLTKREKQKLLKDKWIATNRPTIQAMFQEERKKIILSYLDLTTETAIVLCTRCHYAREKGWEGICPVCKTNYRKLKYPTCSACLKIRSRKK